MAEKQMKKVYILYARDFDPEDDDDEPPVLEVGSNPQQLKRVRKKRGGVLYGYDNDSGNLTNPKKLDPGE